jgi:hypothetical protein
MEDQRSNDHICNTTHKNEDKNSKQDMNLGPPCPSERKAHLRHAFNDWFASLLFTSVRYAMVLK